MRTKHYRMERMRACMRAQLLSCIRLFATPLDCSLPGSCVYGIFHPRILEWVVISYSRDLPDPGVEPTSPVLAGRFFTTEPPEKYIGQTLIDSPRGGCERIKGDSV